MAFLIAAFAAGGILLAPADSDASGRGLSEPVKTCLTENAPKVEEAIPSLGDAVTFLADNICAVPIADENEHRSNAQVKAFKDRQVALCAAEKDKPKAVRIADPCQMADLYDAYDLTGGASLYVSRTPEATAYAANLLLDLRLARLHAKH